jgi:phosphoribosyl 1,2-cyclic phosphodiesterase
MIERVKVISTGSKGNAVVIDKNIMVDCGVSFNKLRGVYKDLQLILLTHIHCDHFNKTTIKILAKERPTLRFACCKWLVQDLVYAGVSLKNIDLLEPNKKYKYSDKLEIVPVGLYHNVDNCGYKIKLNGKRIFYATDTYCLNGIIAPNYDLYLVEANYTEEDIKQRIQAKLEANKYIYEYQAMENHMSKERIDKWLLNNMGDSSEVMYLHRHIESEE